MIEVIGITDDVAGKDRSSGRTWRSISPEQLLLQRQILGDRLDHVVGLTHRLGEVRARPHARDRALVFAEVAQIGGDARLRCVEARRDGVGDGHRMAGERKNLRDRRGP